MRGAALGAADVAAEGVALVSADALGAAGELAVTEGAGAAGAVDGKDGSENVTLVLVARGASPSFDRVAM